MPLQELIDELKRELPGCDVELNIWDGGGVIMAYKPQGRDGAVWGAVAQAKTPDEALALLKQRLGIGEERS